MTTVDATPGADRTPGGERFGFAPPVAARFGVFTTGVAPAGNGDFDCGPDWIAVDLGEAFGFVAFDTAVAPVNAAVMYPAAKTHRAATISKSPINTRNKSSYSLRFGRVSPADG